MQIGFSKKVEVPAEILLYIFRLFFIRDIQNLRLACKAFDSIASLFLLRSLWISPSSRDHEKLLAISQHALFSQTVEEICYDASQSLEKDPIDGRPLSRAQYIRRFSGTWPEKTLGLKMSKYAANRGYQVYKRRLDEEKAAATHSNHDAPYSSDLATLLVALPRMHRVKRLVISDQRYSRMDPTATNTFLTSWNFSCRIEHQGIRGSEAIVLKPRCWVSNDEDYPPFQDRQAHRGFPVMMQAASMLNLTRLESISVDRHSEASGLSYEVFDMSASELQHTLRAFSHLKTLSLKINSIAAPIVFGAPARADAQWAAMIRRGTLAQLCSAAPGLEPRDPIRRRLSCRRRIHLLQQRPLAHKVIQRLHMAEPHLTDSRLDDHPQQRPPRLSLPPPHHPPPATSQRTGSVPGRLRCCCCCCCRSDTALRRRSGLVGRLVQEHG